MSGETRTGQKEVVTEYCHFPYGLTICLCTCSITSIPHFSFFASSERIDVCQIYLRVHPKYHQACGRLRCTRCHVGMNAVPYIVSDITSLYIIKKTSSVSSLGVCTGVLCEVHPSFESYLKRINAHTHILMLYCSIVALSLGLKASLMYCKISATGWMKLFWHLEMKLQEWGWLEAS